MRIRGRARANRLVTLVVGVALLAGVAFGAFAQDLPRPRGYVNDFANIIPESDEAAMRAIITAVQEQTDAEIAVVTVESRSPYPTIEDFGIALAEEWGVGSRGDGGVVFIVALQERDVRIEVGYGLEGAIPDGRAGAILDDYVLPDLREGRYGPGLLNGVAAVAEIVADEYGVTLTGVQSEVRRETASGTDGLDLGDLFYILIVFLFAGGRWFFWPLLFAGRRRGFYGGGFRSSGGFGSSGGSGGSSFGGFSGGSFGGGGASRGF